MPVFVKFLAHKKINETKRFKGKIPIFKLIRV